MTPWLKGLVFKLEPTKPSENSRPILFEWKTSPTKSTGFRNQLLQKVLKECAHKEKAVGSRRIHL